MNAAANAAASGVPMWPVALLLFLALASGARAQDALPLGLGIAQPTALSADAPLYFFGSPEADVPLDSLTVREGAHHFEIATAPPWLAPEAVKLDYDLISFRVVSLRRGWAQVIVHGRDIRWPPTTMWLRRDGLAFHPWAAYWLEIHSIETPEAAPLYATPEAGACPGPRSGGEILGQTEAGRPLHVLEVRSAWARVAYADAPEAESGPLGWVRWHDGDRLLVRYSVLS